jgi:hypothetical protein
MAAVAGAGIRALTVPPDLDALDEALSATAAGIPAGRPPSEAKPAEGDLAGSALPGRRTR